MCREKKKEPVREKAMCREKKREGFLCREKKRLGGEEKGTRKRK
jgi:hypothetical protein